ncbi:hypothetical protein U9M48_042047, partial [Paspalum notatum var. saurae]
MKTCCRFFLGKHTGSKHGLYYSPLKQEGCDSKGLSAVGVMRFGATGQISYGARQDSLKGILIQGGIWAWRLSDSRSSATTRDECLLLHVTPDQLQYWTESFLHDGRIRSTAGWARMEENTYACKTIEHGASVKPVRKGQESLVEIKDPVLKMFLQVLFRGTHWTRLCARMQRTDVERDVMVQGCKFLESTTLHYFASHGWP